MDVKKKMIAFAAAGLLLTSCGSKEEESSVVSRARIL